MYLLFFAFFSGSLHLYQTNMHVTCSLFGNNEHYNLIDKDVNNIIFCSLQDTHKIVGNYISNSRTKSKFFTPGYLSHNEGFHAEALNSRINFEKRTYWIKTALEGLKLQDNVDCQNIEIQSYEDAENQYFKKYIKISKDTTCKIIFPDGSFLKFIAHSVYDSFEIGDITIAINENNISYKNDGHICGGIINFSELKKKDIQSSNDFIRHFKSETDSKGWEILHIK